MNTAAKGGLTVAAVAATGGVFLAGVGVGQLGSSAARHPAPGVVDGPPLALVNADLRTPEDCQDLLDSYIDRGIERVTAWGWHGPFIYAYDGAFPTGQLDNSGGAESSPQSAPVPQPATGRAPQQGNSDTGTNVQEVGVDEPDTVKTNGDLLLRTDGSTVRVYDVTGDSPSLQGDLVLPSLDDPELLLSGDDAVAVGPDTTQDGQAGEVTRVITFDVTDPSNPQITSNRTFSAATVRAVQHGSVVRLILSAGLPELPDFVEPKPWRSQDSALAHNREAVRDSGLADWLPTVTTYDDSGEATSTDPLVDCRRVAIPADEHAEPGTMPIVALDLADPGSLVTSAVATTTSLAYVSTDRLYLASSGWGGWGVTPMPCCLEGDATSTPLQELGTTRIYDFALSGLDATYVASGEVEGMIRDRWAMDSHDGVLRVAVGPSSQTGNFSSVLTLTEQGSDLVLAGRVDELGVDEQIKSVRWFDDLAIVVTFRQTDPLYVIDLSDAEHPRLAGELEIPGYSEYLHPIGGDRLLGVGQDATDTGMTLAAQVALFDVHDLAHPRRTDVVRYPNGSQAMAGQDPRQFTWLADRSTALTVVSSGGYGSSTGWVSVLRVDGDSITGHDVPVEYGADTAQVRLVPLPSGKVVLVTGEAVSFFDV
jgi:hypothetical protein